MWPPVLVAGLAAGCVVPPLSPSMLVAVACIFFPLSSAIPPETTHIGILYSILFVTCVIFGLAITAADWKRLPYVTRDAQVLVENAEDPRMALFLAAVLPFHIIEFVFAHTFQRKELSASAFLLRPVPMHAYCVAMLSAIVEYSIVPLSASPHLAAFGCAGAFCGWAVRSAALFTAQSNFTHRMRDRKHSQHELVTHGVYSAVRHPGYAGWFLWAVSTQVILHNALSMVCYSAVSFAFFRDRIRVEERLLVKFFGQKYIDYARRVPCGIPFITEL